SRADGRAPLAFGPTPGRNRPKLVNGGFVPRSSGPRRLDDPVRLEVDVLPAPTVVVPLRMLIVARPPPMPMIVEPIVVDPKPSIGTSSSRPDVVRMLPISAPPSPMPILA